MPWRGRFEMTIAKTIAIDLGGTQVRAALCEGPRILVRASKKTDLAGGPTDIVKQFESLIDEVSAGADRGDIAGVGLSSAGPVDTELGIVLGIPTIPGWENIPICTLLSNRVGLPVHLENDAIAAALGEWRHGAGQGLQNMVYLTVSTGIGGGAVVDGRLLHGRKGMAAHVGHMRLAQEGPRCKCGAVACFEAFASGTALAERARAAGEADPAGFLGLTLKNKSIGALQVFEGAREGDPQCRLLVDQEAAYLGQGITSIIHAFSPEQVVLGGGLSHSFDLLEAGIHAVIAADAMAPFKQVRVVPSMLGDNSGLVGAATMALERAGS